jgi:glyoxylase-like metal-dependent hydrolase (beta-lactamase superfamily II)
LAAELGVPLFAPPSYAPAEASQDLAHPIRIETLREGDTIPTDHGELEVLEIPGHSQEHLGFFWRDSKAAFVGDLILGKGKTTWVGEYLDCVEDYLTSLDRLDKLHASVLYPSHGPPVRKPKKTIQRFRQHRLERLEELRALRSGSPEATAEELAELIYGGTIPEKLVKAARSGVEAAIHHLDRARNRA